MRVLQEETTLISSGELVGLLGQAHLQVIDVRDLDFFMGHIPGTRHVPSQSFQEEVGCIATEYATSGKLVVIHCMTSQGRAPVCARLLLDCLKQSVPEHDCTVKILAGGFAAWELHCISQLQDTVRFISRDVSQYRGDACSRPLSPVSSWRNLRPELLPLLAEGREEACFELPPYMVADTDSWRQSAGRGDVISVYSHSTHTWHQGLVVKTDETRVQVQYFVNGRCCRKALDRASSDLKPAVPEGATWRDRLSVGHLVAVRSDTAGGWVEALVTATSATEVALQYFVRGRPCHKSLPRTSADLQPAAGHCVILEEPEQALEAEENWGGARPKAQDTEEGVSDARPAALDLKPAAYADEVAPEQTRPPAVVAVLDAAALAEAVASQTDVQVIDVRDLDFFVGCIPRARRAPHEDFDEDMPLLAREFADQRKTLVFHCMDSEIRGPSCSKRFLEHLEEHYPARQCKVALLRGGFSSWRKWVRLCDAGGQPLPEGWTQGARGSLIGVNFAGHVL